MSILRLFGRTFCHFSMRVLGSRIQSGHLEYERRMLNPQPQYDQLLNTDWNNNMATCLSAYYECQWQIKPIGPDIICLKREKKIWNRFMYLTIEPNGSLY